jgi:hypothetical protein
MAELLQHVQMSVPEAEAFSVRFQQAFTSVEKADVALLQTKHKIKDDFLILVFFLLSKDKFEQ